MTSAGLAEGRLVSVLHCPACQGEQPHEVRLDQEGVVETACRGCGRTVSLPQRRSARIALGPYVIGGGAPLLVVGRVPAGVPASGLAQAVRMLAAAGAHAVELDLQQAQDALAQRLAGEIPVALVVDAGQRLADAYRLLSRARAHPAGGWAAVRWSYDGQPGHLGLLMAAAARHRVPLVVAAPLGAARAGALLDALARGQGPVLLEFCGDPPQPLLAAYEQAAQQVRCPFYGRLPREWLEGERAGESARLGTFLRQRLLDGVGAAAADPLAGADAAAAADGAALVRRLLAELWLPVAPPPPRAAVSVVAGPRVGWPVPVPVLGTLRSAAGVPGRVVRGLRNPAVARLPARVLTKPLRFWHEVRRDGPGVLWSVPRRVATKPVRLMRQLGREVRGRS